MLSDLTVVKTLACHNLHASHVCYTNMPLKDGLRLFAGQYAIWRICAWGTVYCCFAQVAGFKYIRLYSRQQTPMLYVDTEKGSTSAKSATRAQRNISAVKIEEPDLKQHSKFADAQFTECILAPGEMLFIPAKYWHYVRSLSPAVSVNFWY